MDILTFIYIVLGVISLLIISHVIAIVVYRNHLKKYESNQDLYISSFLNTLDKKLSNHINALNEQLNTLQKNHETTLLNLKTSNFGFLESQDKAFKKHTEDLKINYSSYVTKVDHVNEQLSSILVKLNTGIDDYKILSETLRFSYKELETLSDKTKELQSDHERLISLHESQFKEMLKNVRENANQKLTQLSADGENNFTKLRDKAERTLDEVSSKSIAEINSLMKNDSFIQFTENVRVMKTRFDEQISDLKLQLIEINKNMESIVLKQEANNGRSMWSRLWNK